LYKKIFIFADQNQKETSLDVSKTQNQMKRCITFEWNQKTLHFFQFFLARVSLIWMNKKLVSTEQIICLKNSFLRLLLFFSIINTNVATSACVFISIAEEGEETTYFRSSLKKI
jgi:hypothetical protein